MIPTSFPAIAPAAPLAATGFGSPPVIDFAAMMTSLPAPRPDVPRVPDPLPPVADAAPLAAPADQAQALLASLSPEAEVGLPAALAAEEADQPAAKAVRGRAAVAAAPGRAGPAARKIPVAQVGLPQQAPPPIAAPDDPVTDPAKPKIVVKPAVQLRAVPAQLGTPPAVLDTIGRPIATPPVPAPAPAAPLPPRADANESSAVPAALPVAPIDDGQVEASPAPTAPAAIPAPPASEPEDAPRGLPVQPEPAIAIGDEAPETSVATEAPVSAAAEPEPQTAPPAQPIPVVPLLPIVEQPGATIVAARPTRVDPPVRRAVEPAAIDREAAPASLDADADASAPIPAGGERGAFATLVTVAAATPGREDRPAGLDAPALPDTAEQVIAHRVSAEQDAQSLDALARDIVRAATPGAKLSFAVTPDTLGAIGVELQQSDRGTAIRLTSDNEESRQILADAQPRLVQEARAQGLRIAETHVDLGQQPDGGRHQQPVWQRAVPAAGSMTEITPSGGPATAATPSDRFA